MFKLRRKTRHLLFAGAAGFILSALIAGSLWLAYAQQVREARQAAEERWNQELSALKEAVEHSTVKVWVPSKPLETGQMITLEDLTQQELPKDRIPDQLLTSSEDIVGRVAKLSLPANMPLADNLLWENEPLAHDLRYREMGFIQLPEAAGNGSMVDVRIQFPTGQDYILLSKKKISELRDQDGVVTMTLDEKELLSLSSAIVDAYLHKASIYALLYVEPGIQAEAIPTYPANEAVLQLMKKDPNIVKQAELELAASARARLDGELAVLDGQSSAAYAASLSSASGQQRISDNEAQFVMSPSD
ncbi:hypothetical protein J41TS12_21430 [Paenibacillus antibioticophila]|uniref:SAF domain-containing protein n=1 Tax=Paenibacillus antibioticophila TaxID=1274374 RepID=A0A919XV95_9BACL|nr:SAF domain-containing protein [Paenibacillus antibioticophila]GIO37282.1 hypothetical protein J41TS12_21430 [Paenibacillus antibioticophila]